MGLLDLLRKARRAESTPKNRSDNGRKKDRSEDGTHKWQTRTSLQKYRRARNTARKVARLSRRRDRA